MKRRILSAMLSVSILVSAFVILTFSAAADSIVTVTGANTDYSTGWGMDPGEGIMVALTFSEAYDTGAADATLADAITINGVSLRTRLDDPASLGADNSTGTYGGVELFFQNQSNPNVLEIILLGGGEGNVLLNGTNTLVLDDSFPMAGGALGRTVNMACYDFAAGWNETNTDTTVSAVLYDWSEGWGLSAGKGMQINLVFSKDYTNAPLYAYLTNELAPFLVVNGVNLADRIADGVGGDLGIGASDGTSWTGVNTALSVGGNTVLSMILIGGGTGHPSTTGYNTVTLLPGFPMAQGVLGKEITIYYDPSNGTWGDADPYADNTDTVISVDSFNDWSDGWGTAPVPGLQLDLNFSKEFTAAGDNTWLNDSLKSFIVINGVSLADRIADGVGGDLGVLANPGVAWNGANTVLNVSGNGTVLNIVMIGGGEGNLSFDEYNTVVLLPGFPMEQGVLGKEVTLGYNKTTREWSELINVDTVAPVDLIPVIKRILLKNDVQEETGINWKGRKVDICYLLEVIKD